MSHDSIQLPSQPIIVTEENNQGRYQIDGLYPGYGHTLGNSLRRIILSSVPGAAITSIKIDGADHEFTTLEGVKEDVINILLNLKQVRIKMTSNEPVVMTLKNATGTVTAGDIETPGQLEIMNPEMHIATVTGKKGLTIEMTVEHGLGYVPKEVLQKEKVTAGTIALDAIFTPVRRVNYEVENMRVGDRTDFNRINMFIETDGSVSPREVLEEAIRIMIHQLKAIVGFREEEEEVVDPALEVQAVEEAREEALEERMEEEAEVLKTRIDTLGLSTRTENALDGANIRTIGGLVRKKEQDILDLEGLGEKGLQEIKRVLGNYGIILKQ